MLVRILAGSVASGGRARLFVESEAIVSKQRLIYVLSTHWDREWHQTFQEFRYLLVRLLDRVLAGIEDGRLKGPFQTDGQAILLEDYLEVRPQRREQVERMVRERKLVVGPWYVMPDEFLVSGESLIRNLELGRKMVRSFGGRPSDAGFVCDMFGHTGQLPQIFAGFGIRGGFVWRGTNTIEKRNLRWRGADGTELLCFRFGNYGYGGYSYYVRHFSDIHGGFAESEFGENLEKFISEESERTDIDTVLLFDGIDHCEWDQQAYEALIEYMEKNDGVWEFSHADLDEYLGELLGQADRVDTMIEGELREPGRYPVDEDVQWLIPGVLSSRVNIRQANNECQTMLCQWAEPFCAFADAAVGLEYPQGYLNVAWKWLLQNHAHDSICGCSVDQVHKDMEFRFDQCRGIADRVTRESLCQLGASIGGDVGEKELRVVVFNPHVRDVDEVAELTLQIPADWPVFGEFFWYEPKPAFRVYDADDVELPYQRIGQAMSRSKARLRPTKMPESYKSNDVKVALRVAIPAMGYTTLTVRAGVEGEPTRHAATPGMATSERSMENEHLAATIEANGSVTLADKRTGEVYDRLLTFEDCADIGDGWYHGVAVNDGVFVSTGSRCDVVLVTDGPMLTSFRIRTRMSVPREFCFDGMVRSDDVVEMVIDSLVSLRPGQGYLDVETTVDNVADDHRLRVLLASGANAETYLAEGAFDVVERPIALAEENHQWREVEVETKPQQSWTAVHDGKRGLAVVAAGLLESAVRDLPERTIALTLFRGTRRTPFTDGEPAGQLRGQMTFRYRIFPLGGSVDRTTLCEQGQRIAAGLRAQQFRPDDIALHRGVAVLPPRGSLLRIDGPVVASSVRQVGEGLEVRLFNPTDETISGKVDTSVCGDVVKQPTEAELVDFEGGRVDTLTGRGGIFEVMLAPKKIATLRLMKGS